MRLTDRLRRWARSIKRDALTLWYVSRHPRTPIAAKALAVCLVVYAFSPIDLIPDFIPLLGLLDDAIILPLGIILVVRLVPQQILDDCRVAATFHVERGDAKPISRIGSVAIVVIWIAMAIGVVTILLRSD